MIAAVIFDFDGVILESSDIKTVAFVDLFAHLGAEKREQVRRHHLDNLGVSRFRKFEWIYKNIVEQPLSQQESQALGQRFSDLVYRRVLEAPFVPGAPEALGALGARSVPMFVASGTPQEELDTIVAERGLKPHFVEVWGSPTEKDVIINDILARHRLARENVLFVGDGLSDHKAATATGVHFVARDTPEHATEWLARKVARIPDMHPLPGLVAGWS